MKGQLKAPHDYKPSEREAEPAYPSDHVRTVSEKLEAAYSRKEEIVSAGLDVAEIDREILELKRLLRDGPSLSPGYLLQDERYRLISAAGKGGFATIWKAYNKKTGKLSAIKVLHGQFAIDQSGIKRFFRRADKMYRLRHPGVVDVIETHGEEDGFHFFVMEYLEGGDLRNAVIEKRFNQEQIYKIILQVGEALQYAHERELIHRDIKPANILIAKDGTAQLTDFDLVKTADTTGGTRTGAMGSYIYVSPEALESAKEATAASDIYSLGMILIFGLYGRDLPLNAVKYTESFIQKLNCTARIKEILTKAANWESEQRHGSVKEF